MFMSRLAAYDVGAEGTDLLLDGLHFGRRCAMHWLNLTIPLHPGSGWQSSKENENRVEFSGHKSIAKKCGLNLSK